MNSLERAIEILEDEHDPFAGLIDAPSLAYALNDAGLIAAAPDLAHTVVEQAASIEQLDTELDAVASHSLAQGRKLRRQAAQIERVREVLAWAEQAETRAHADWMRTADTHHRDAALAYTQAVTWLRYALGDTDG